MLLLDSRINHNQSVDGFSVGHDLVSSQCVCHKHSSLPACVHELLFHNIVSIPWSRRHEVTFDKTARARLTYQNQFERQTRRPVTSMRTGLSVFSRSQFFDNKNKTLISFYIMHHSNWSFLSSIHNTLRHYSLKFKAGVKHNILYPKLGPNNWMVEISLCRATISNLDQLNIRAAMFKTQ